MITFLSITGSYSYGQTKDEEDAWRDIEMHSGSHEDKIRLLEVYIKKYPQSPNIETAKKQKKELRDEYANAIFDKALRSNDPQLMADALKKYPSHQASKKLKARLSRMDQDAWKDTDKKDSISLRKYVENYPDGRHFDEAVMTLRGFDRKINIPAGPKADDVMDLQKMGVAELNAFIANNPGLPVIKEAKRILQAKENFYFNRISANKDNFPAYKKSVIKFQKLFPESTKLPTLLGDLKVRQIKYDTNKNKPEYISWYQLNRSDLMQLRDYSKKYPANPFKDEIAAIESRLEENMYSTAVRTNSLIDIDRYLSSFPHGAHTNKLIEIKNRLEKNNDFPKVRKWIAGNDKPNLEGYLKTNNKSPLRNSVANYLERTGELNYSIDPTDEGLQIRILNYDQPTCTISDPNEEIDIDSSGLISQGLIVVSFEAFSTDAIIIIKDSNGRERKIRIDRLLEATLEEIGEGLRLLIKGGIPPYIIEFKNIDLGYIQKTFENINTDRDDRFIIMKDSLSDLSGQYALLLKNNDNGQVKEFSGLMFENTSSRTTWFAILAGGVLLLTFSVIRLYIRRSRKKTIFDEYE